MKSEHSTCSSMNGEGQRPGTRAVWLLLAAAALSCDRSTEPPRGIDGATGVAGVEGHSRPARVRFVDRAAELGIAFRHDRGARGDLQLFETMGGGAAWLDHDRDGDPDLYLVSGQEMNTRGEFPEKGRNRLYRNDQSRFVDVTEEAGVPGRGYGLGAAVGDIDNDGFPDLYVLCFGPNVLYHNRGDGSFEELPGSGTEGVDPFSGGAAFADFDGDGLVDLFVSSYVEYDHRDLERCSERPFRGGERVPIYCGPLTFVGAPDRLYHNLGGGRFREVSVERGIGRGLDARSKSLGVLAADIDEDGDVDICVACDTTANLLYRNRGDGTFEEVGLELGVAVSDVGRNEGGMGIAFADVDGDGRGDLFVTNFAEELNRLHLARPDGDYRDATALSGLGRGARSSVGWGVGFIDAACDGKLDLFIANGHIYHNAEMWLPEQVYRQRNFLYSPAGSRYEERGEAAGPGFGPRGVYRGAAFADHDLDGDLDILVMALDERPRLLEAEGPRGHHVTVRLLGDGPGGRDAVGARVELVDGGGERQVRWRTSGGSYLSESDDRIHFGLGNADRVKSIRVSWPGGGTTDLEDVRVDTLVEVRRAGK